MRFVMLCAALALIGGCANNPTAEDVLTAVQIRDNQCGKATITGNLDIGGTFGFFGSTVTVNIDKSKRTYTDAAGTIQDCPR